MDHVSSLPDEILCHILSFLPTKESASTSALAKRWLNIWKLVPNLDIDDSVFLHPEEGKGEREEIRQSFVDFVDRVLAMQGDSPVKKFSLKCITGVHPDCVNRWICNVLQRGVSDLDLFTDFPDVEGGYQLPREMFISKTLVNLKLRSCVDWWCDNDIHHTFLPMLKSLQLDSVVIFGGNIGTFLPYFPVLEELHASTMEWSDFPITVSSPSIRKLILRGISCEEGINPQSVSFDTPSLLSLSYMDAVAEDYPLVNMKNLSVAHINLILMEDQVERIRSPNNDWLEDEDYDVVKQFGNVVKLMNGIQNVQRLSLVSDTLEVLSLCCESMPEFNNLKSLAIKSDKDRGWQAMPVLLRNCPHLETIILEGLFHHVTEKCGDACPCIPQEDKGRSLTSCPVKKLHIKGFRGSFRELSMVRHFMVSFPCLEVMRLYAEEKAPTDFDPTDFEVPENFEFIENNLILFRELSSCDVKMVMPSDPLSKIWRQVFEEENLAHGFGQLSL